MTRYADPERCPDCQAAMPYGATRCPACGLSLEGPLASELYSTLVHADELLTTLRAAGPAATVTSTAPPAAAASAASEAGGGLATLTWTETQAPPGPVGPGGPGREPRPPRGLSGASVPKILLGLGALCLLVAALVFLAVTWSSMGVAARTATLVGFTGVAGGLTAWAARRDLRAAAESLGVVALGLLTFDLFGARDAGWLGDVTTPEFFLVLGSVVAVAGAGAALAVRRTPAAALVGAELISALGVTTAVAGGVAADRLPWSAGLTLAVLVAAAVAFAANRVRLPVLSVAASMTALAGWMVLTLSAWDRAAQHPSLRELWLGLEAWPLLAAAALAGALLMVRGLPSTVRLFALGVAALVLSAIVLAPVTDETLTERTLAGALLLVALATLALAVPPPWRSALGLPGSLALLWVGLSGVALATEAMSRIVEAGAVSWSGEVSGVFAVRPVTDTVMAGWLLPVTVAAVAVALVAGARTFGGVDRAVAPLVDLDGVLAAVAAILALTPALFAAPLWTVLAVLLLSGTVLVARWLAHGRMRALALGAAFLVIALQLSLHAPWLTLVTTVLLLPVAVAVYLRTDLLELAVAGGAAVAAATAGLVWTVGALVAVAEEWTAVAALLVLALLVLAGPVVDERFRRADPATMARLGPELGALAAALVVSVAGMDAVPDATKAEWLAVYLTVTGATAVALALLRTDRRWAGWLGGFLLAAASWVRLADLGVETPEAYTLPSALALVVLGWYHLRVHPGSSTMAALSPGLLLALLPTLLWVLLDPLALRSLVLGAACLALVVGGARLRWSAPLVHGAAVGALLVIRHAAPLADAAPRWALIGATGVLLLTMGITWEARVRDARRVAGYIQGLR